jgi:hypothetical protein
MIMPRPKRSIDLEPVVSLQSTPSQTYDTLVQFEDLHIVRTRETGEICIDKKSGGIADSTYSLGAVGSQKNWALYTEGGVLIDTGSQHGNRVFHWQGVLEPGTYTLTTGPSHVYTKRRVAGRGYKIMFRV